VLTAATGMLAVSSTWLHAPGNETSILGEGRFVNIAVPSRIRHPVPVRIPPLSTRRGSAHESGTSLAWRHGSRERLIAVVELRCNGRSLSTSMGAGEGERAQGIDTRGAFDAPRGRT